ncbi:GABA permease protein [Rutstroemia sp. NJR-2017a WRK4]|nr:GABA permease protein [Rutstroemia sp. NJR-2017a WRK4]PQE14813.1 GABA permease protein [Rutstroemia sp. NJR-2017a WRK4]
MVFSTKGQETGVVELGPLENNGAARHLSDSRDRNELARLGKKPVLKRNFGFMSILGFSCTVLITWEGSLILFLSGLQNGGPAGIVYGFLLIWIGNLSVFSTLSELVSMAPTSGGQYHWVSMMAPPSCSKFLSYITGWLTVGGWQGAVASGGYLTGTLIQGLIALTVPTYEPKGWQGTLLFWSVIFFAVFINAIVSSLLPKFEGLILVLHIVGFFIILIPLIILAPHDTAENVFTVWLNGGGWPTQGVSFFVGLIGNVFAFVGADGAFHMSEEIRNPSIVVPRSIMLSVIINGSLGFAMIVALLFCIGNVDDALGTNTGYPFMQIFLQATQSVSGAATMAAIVTILALCATVGILASTSRMFWAFARDRGLPGWRTLQQVNPSTTIPLWSIAVTTIVSCLLALINIGSAAAFNNVISLSVAGLYTSYLICAVLLLYRRTTGGFQEVSSNNSDRPIIVNTAGAQLIWGPWHIPGLFGILNNTFAIVYLTIILFFSFWPPVIPVTVATMNYSSLVTGSVMIFSVLYYLVRGRHEWKGPIIEVHL